jgi:succinate dehydrogenase hydrophobic anchor subunit
MNIITGVIAVILCVIVLGAMMWLQISYHNGKF